MSIRLSTACFLVSAALLSSRVDAQPLQLLERGTPELSALRDPVTREYRAPLGDWRAFLAWARTGAAPEGPLMGYVDSGVMAAHPFIRPVLRSAIDLTGEGPEDEIGHGTSVALIGILTMASGTAGFGPVFAPIVSIKIVGRKPRSDGPALMVEALRRAATEGVASVNLSTGVDLGCVNARDPNGSPYLGSCEETPICREVTRLVKLEGILVVAAVGNTPGRTACPACCRDALAVGASDATGQPASYNGAFPDIMAPGAFQSGPTPVGPAR